MDFGDAVRAMKKGHLIQREGWNGKGLHVYLEEHFDKVMGYDGSLSHTRNYKPVMVLYNGNDNHQPGWVPSTADTLAEDWRIVR